MRARPVKTLILGLGNPLLGDDAVGLAVTRRLAGRLDRAEVQVATEVGLGLLEIIAGYDRLYVVDALVDQAGPPGEVTRTETGVGALHLFSSHGLDFFQILEFGRRMGYALPVLAGVYGIRIGQPASYRDGLSEDLGSQVEGIGQAILRQIEADLDGQGP